MGREEASNDNSSYAPIIANDEVIPEVEKTTDKSNRE
jgi:hypothetical protein